MHTKTQTTSDSGAGATIPTPAWGRAGPSAAVHQPPAKARARAALPDRQKAFSVAACFQMLWWKETRYINCI